MSLFPALYTAADVTSGHGMWPPVGYAPPPVGASANVMINGAFVHHVGDTTLPHYSFLPVPPDLHSDVISTGEPSVLVNGTPIAIQGLSFLAPAGLVAGLAAVDVVVRIGNLTNATTEAGVSV
jgi:uncharacterized Zn-binding protein involved in type VI secretion